LSRNRLALAAVAAVALVSASVMAPGMTHAATAGTSVSVWETTADHTKLLASQTGATFASGSGSASQTITINPSTTYQTMSGFGASFTDSSAWLVYNSPLRNTIMTKLFDPSQGVGLSFLRQPIGASDFARSVYSYDDGAADPNLTRFSIAHDNSYILPILVQARSLNPSITTMASPWSPPGWMKTSGNMIGGSLNTTYNQAFANYLVKFIQAYQAAGVPINLITPQNEPEYSPSNYPGSTWSASAEASFIQTNLGPAIASAGLSTKIIGYDHNWDDTSFPSTVLANAGQYTAGVAWHCYAGNSSAQTTVHNSYPTKDTYFTECSGTQSNPTTNTFSDTLMWHAENLIIGTTRNWAKSVVTWNMALDPSGGPSMNCTTCTGVVTVNNSNGTVTYNAEYYTLGHVAKFVKPGATRVDSNTFGSSNIEDVAFVNPDGSHVLFVQNADSASHTFNVSENGSFFTYTLPAKSIATFTWAGGTPTPTPTPSATSTRTPAPTASRTATSSGTIDSTKWYQVVNVNSQKCVDAAGGGTGNGTAVQQWTCYTGNTNQQWQFQPTDSGFYKVVTRNATTMAWDITGGAGATGNGAQIQLWTYGGGTNQQWKPVKNADGSYKFNPRNNTAECLDVTNVSTADGARLQQWACNGGTNQSFTLAVQA
jgi:glucosylceramidase